MGARGWGRGEGVSVSRGQTLWEDGKVLETDGGDGCTMWTCLMPLNCALKMVKTVNVMCPLPQFLKSTSAVARCRVA